MRVDRRRLARMDGHPREDHDAFCQELRIKVTPPDRSWRAAMPISPFSLDDSTAPATADGRRDFDFLIGRWDVAHRRLQRRLEGDARWDSFAGRSEMRLILGGLGNIDDNVIEVPGGT